MHYFLHFSQMLVILAYLMISELCSRFGTNWYILLLLTTSGTKIVDCISRQFEDWISRQFEACFLDFSILWNLSEWCMNLTSRFFIAPTRHQASWFMIIVFFPWLFCDVIELGWEKKSYGQKWFQNMVNFIYPEEITKEI